MNWNVNTLMFLNKVEKILKPLSEFFLEENYAFIAAAEWPDDIKGMHWSNFNLLHFLNSPIIDPKFEGLTQKHLNNSTFAYDEWVDVLSQEETKILKISRSICMRVIIHLIGDIHQPLHAGALYNNMFPNGDKGGNLFTIINLEKKSLNQLHKFWDSAAGNYGIIYAPITFKKYKKIQKIVYKITEKYSRKELRKNLKLAEWLQWIEESRMYALHIVYDNLNLQSGDTLTEEYIERAKEFVDHQIALGGYRLADALVAIFGDS